MMRDLKKLIVGGVVAMVAIIVLAQSCTIVQQRERGVKFTLGKVSSDEIIQPGMNFKAPFVQKIKKYSIAPKTFDVKFSVGQDGAITKDMQTVGTAITVKYNFDESRIMDIAKRYGDSVVESAMKSNIIASLKEVVGKYSIYDLVSEQGTVTSLVEKTMIDRMTDYPIQISQITITNWDWSDDFDNAIKQTQVKAQETRQAEQALKLAEINSQKQVAEAEAAKKAAEQTAEAELIKALKAAEARKAEADALAYYNSKVAQNYQVEIKLKELEIELERAKKWDGRQVPEYVPLTAAGGIVNLPTSK